MDKGPIHCKDTIPNLKRIFSRKGIARPQSQFPHSCVFDRFICSHDRSTYFLQQNRQTSRVWKLGLRPRNSFLGTHKWDFRCSVWTGQKMVYLGTPPTCAPTQFPRPLPHHPASLSWYSHTGQYKYWPFWTDVISLVLYLLKGCSHFLYNIHIDNLQGHIAW